MRRISKEIQRYSDQPLKNVYIDFDDDNLKHLEILMIAPRYTPYSRMFIRFTLDFPDNYPLKPPDIYCISNFGKKIHPNIYPTKDGRGHPCLSILISDKKTGWGDDSNWAPTISLTALLATLYSIFNADMIQKDNVHKNDKGDEYFPGVMYDMFYVTSKLLKEEHNEKFKTIMKNYLDKHRDWYLRKLDRLSKEYDGKLLPNYTEPSVANFKSLIASYTK